jgi:hypothetical protein
MSSWTYVQGLIELGVPGRTQAEKDYVKLHSRKDTYHVKSNWRISLPEPEGVSKKELL